MTFADFSITLKLEENTKFVYLYTTSSADMHKACDLKVTRKT